MRFMLITFLLLMNAILFYSTVFDKDRFISMNSWTGHTTIMEVK